MICGLSKCHKYDNPVIYKSSLSEDPKMNCSPYIHTSNRTQNLNPYAVPFTSEVHLKMKTKVNEPSDFESFTLNPNATIFKPIVNATCSTLNPNATIFAHIPNFKISNLNSKVQIFKPISNFPSMSESDIPKNVENPCETSILKLKLKLKFIS